MDDERTVSSVYRDGGVEGDESRSEKGDNGVATPATPEASLKLCAKP